MIRIFSEFKTGDMLIRYIQDGDRSDAAPGLMIVPLGTENRVPVHREDISNQKEAYFFKDWGGFPRAAKVAPLVQICCSGDDYSGGFSQGISMQNSSTTAGLLLKGQKITEHKGSTIIRTEMSAPNQLSIAHELTVSGAASYITCRSNCKNNGKKAVEIELLTSFTLSMLTPFSDTYAPGRLKLHRFRSSWSAEGRHCREAVEELGLEQSWSTHGVRSERFGQAGSMPVRKWFPFAAVEDIGTGVFWAVNLDAPASWQIEAYRKDDYLNLSGGPADLEFGHWSKRLQPDEEFTTRPAAMTTVQGTLDKTCARLLERQQIETHATPEADRTCPVVYNEWCASWGRPSEERIIQALPWLQELGTGYYIIDAGWYADLKGNWENSHGDWNISGNLFPEGFTKICTEIRKHGMVPGLWFEFETVGEDSEISRKTDFLLKRNGKPIKSGLRFFLDLRRQDVRSYLNAKVTALLKNEGFGYLKIDYNETIGTGCDTEDNINPASGLQEQVEKVQEFINDIRSEIPGIVIENCSSGGHREEPSFINLTDMCSFSDAHETDDIPIIAANLTRLVIPSKCQIWAVLHHEDSFKRLFYSLSAPFMGRMCLSGEIDKLSPEQFEIIRDAVRLYRKAAEIIDSLDIRRYGPQISSYRRPAGWQGVLKISRRKGNAFLVVHTFSDAPEKIRINLPHPLYNWRISEIFGEQQAESKDGAIMITDIKDYCGSIIFFEERK